MRRALALTALSLALTPAALLLAPSEAAACSCMKSESALASARDADLVFTAKLESVADAPASGPHALPEKIFSFEVTRTFKGQLDAKVNVRTANNSAACGRGYGDPGSEWLIYASQADDGTIRDNLCSRTMALDKAAADIEELEANLDGLDQENPEPEPEEEPVEPAEPEPEPVQPDADAEGGPEPAKPSKKGCAVAGEDLGGAPWFLGLLLLAPLARRRRS